MAYSEEMNPWVKETIFLCSSLTAILITIPAIKHCDFSTYEKCRLYSALKEVTGWISDFKEKAFSGFPDFKG